MQVFQNDDQGLYLGSVTQEGRDGVEQPPAVVLGVGGIAQVYVDAVTHFRDDARNFSGSSAELRTQRLRVTVEDVGAHRLNEGQGELSERSS